MKVIEQSFEILSERENPIKQIAERARICYKSEDKAKEDETTFVQGIIKHGHNSCLEMFVEHLFIPWTKLNPQYSITYKALLENPYLTVTEMNPNNGILVTGSIRAFREFIIANRRELPLFTNVLLHFFLNHPYEAGDSFSVASEYTLAFHNLFTDLGPVESLPDFGIVNMHFDETTPADIIFKHHHVAVKFFTNRAVTHELVRHRRAAFLQESQRYCRYSDERFGNEVTFIKPTAFPAFTNQKINYSPAWYSAMEITEDIYLELLKVMSPQAARTVLPNSCKTEIIVYADLREWSHIFAMRAINEHAEPSMREAMIPVHNAFINLYRHISQIINPVRSVG